MAYSDTNKDPEVGDKVYNLHRLETGRQPNGVIHDVDPDHESVIVLYGAKLEALNVVSHPPQYMEYGWVEVRSSWRADYLDGMYLIEEE